MPSLPEGSPAALLLLPPALAPVAGASSEQQHSFPAPSSGPQPLIQPGLISLATSPATPPLSPSPPQGEQEPGRALQTASQHCPCFPYRHALVPGTARDQPECSLGCFSPPPACSELVSAPASVAPPLPGARAASPPLWSASCSQESKLESCVRPVAPHAPTPLSGPHRLLVRAVQAATSGRKHAPEKQPVQGHHLQGPVSGKSALVWTSAPISPPDHPDPFYHPGMLIPTSSWHFAPFHQSLTACQVCLACQCQGRPPLPPSHQPAWPWSS